MVGLLDFWRLKRSQTGQACVIRPHHVQIADALTKLVLGLLPTPNLMVLMPPRMTKTDLAVKAFVPWSMSTFPDSEYIVTGYAEDLAVASVVDIRETLASEWYRQMVASDWGARVTMIGDRAGGRQDFFHTQEGGSVKAKGMSGGITGFGAGKLRPEWGGCIVVDDPLKAQDADSPVMREAAFDFIENTLKTRRNRDDTPIVLIMQRLHPEDPAGRYLREEREKWAVLPLQAHLPSGASIWEDRISAQSLTEMRIANPQKYWSQYQQEPQQGALTIFHEDWWWYWKHLAEVERRISYKIITADTAFKAEDANDWSVLQCWGFEGTSGAYLLDQWRGKWEFPELIRNARTFLKLHSFPRPGVTPASAAYVEDRASGTSLVQSLRREGLAFKEWLPSDKAQTGAKMSLKSTGKKRTAHPDKKARADACTLVISTGRVFLPHPVSLGGYDYGFAQKIPEFQRADVAGREFQRALADCARPYNQWVRGFVNEHTAFSSDDSHLHDDQVDGETQALMIWQQKGGAKGSPVPVWKAGLVERAVTLGEQAREAA